MRDCLIGGYRNDKEVFFLDCKVHIIFEMKIDSPRILGLDRYMSGKFEIDDNPNQALTLADIAHIYPGVEQIIVDYKHDGAIYRLIDNPLTKEKEWAKVGTTIGYEVV